jgi:gluconokinase
LQVDSPIVVVMGVSGSGKSTLAERLAQALQVTFLEGDSFHPADNVRRMAQGIPLTDADRQGWLATMAQRLADARARGEGAVLACSALKRSYRDLLRAAVPDLRLVHVHGTASLIGERLAQRKGHYMPPSLLQSQLADLEPPAADEHPLTLDAVQPVEVLLASALAQWRTGPPDA